MKTPWENLHVALGIGLVLALIVLVVSGHLSWLGDSVFWSFLFRWIHIFFGVLWIGLLYYFNFVQIPSMPKIPGRAEAGDQQGHRAGSAVLLPLGGGVHGALRPDRHGLSTSRGTNTSLAIGMLLGLIMAYNVWFIIWPNQQKVAGPGRGRCRQQEEGRAHGHADVAVQHHAVDPHALRHGLGTYAVIADQ